MLAVIAARRVVTDFEQGSRVALKVAAVVLSHYRMGILAAADGGARFALQRVG